jgi:hypothetical protein
MCEHPLQHRLPRHREQLLRHGVGERPEPGALPADEDDCPHLCDAGVGVEAFEPEMPDTVGPDEPAGSGVAGVEVGVAGVEVGVAGVEVGVAGVEVGVLDEAPESVVRRLDLTAAGGLGTGAPLGRKAAVISCPS